MYKRSIHSDIAKKIGSGKAIIIVGARQVGKTTLINTILKGQDVLFLDADDIATRSLMRDPTTEQLKSIIGDSKTIFLDEAQRIDNIGITLKIITDQFKGVQLFVSGSSSFDLGNRLNEPLTGRKWEYELFPISWEEFEESVGMVKSEQQVENRLLYGFYPDVLNNPGQEKIILKTLVNSYLFRDVLAFRDLKKPEVLDKLLQALALQLGNEVNFNELASTVSVDKNTISKYIDILEKSYVIFRLPSFSRNVRNEIKKGKKIYFYDNGVRNAIIGNFNPLETRVDKGALWENFLVSERRKQNYYKATFARMYFWRTKQQQEIDFVEEIADKVSGFEFKWSSGRSVSIPKTFTDAYNANTLVISRENFRDFVVIK